MTGGPGAEGAPPAFTAEELAWLERHKTELRRSVAEQGFLRWSLVTAVVVGLAAHVGGYALRAAAPPGPLGLVADLLYALGLALWTGVLVALFVQLLPEWKRRQVARYLDAYEGALREKPRAGGDRAAPGSGARAGATIPRDGAGGASRT
jgi:hypothetical protein